MIKSISIINDKGEMLDLNLRNPWLSGFAVMDVEGLEPVSVTVNTTELSTLDGSVYNSSRLGNRNIVLRIAILDKPTVEDSRHLLYRFFPSKKSIILAVNTDKRSVYTTGYVERNTISIFSNLETASISIVCPDPYFYSVDEVITNLYGVIGGFEFPFSNEVGTNTLKFGENTPNSSALIFYPGDVRVGVEFYIHAVGTFTNLRLYNITTDQEILLDTSKIALITGSAITAGDDIYINTIPGKKCITLTRSGVEYNILNCISKDTNWIQLEPGDNELVYSATGIQNSRINVVNKIIFEGA